ncbi:MAG: ATP-binding protein [Calditrichota bacterium]
MTHEEFQIILQTGEGHKVEFKRSPSNLDREIVAFANAAGGRILIGVDDSGEAPGIAIDEHLKSHIIQMAKNCIPPVHVTLEEWEEILIVTVQEGWMKPHRFSSGYYLRNGATSQRLEREEILHILNVEGRIRFDRLFIPRFDFYTHFDKMKYDRVLRMADLSHTADIDRTLEELHAAEKQEGRLIFNNTGILFFARNLADFYYHTAIDCVLYEGIDRSQVIAKRSSNADLITAVDDTLSFLKENLRIYDDEVEKTPKGIPYHALKELVVNAVAHRNYFEKGGNVRVEIFDDRVIISNPGGLPAGLPEESFGERSEQRNPNLAELLKLIGYSETTGHGIPRVRERIKEAGLPPVEFEFGDQFQASIRLPHSTTSYNAEPVKGPSHEKQPVLQNIDPPDNDSGSQEGLSPDDLGDGFRHLFGEKYSLQGDPLDRKIAILQQVVAEEHLDYEGLKARFQVSQKTLKRDLTALKNLDLIVFTGAPKTGKYELTTEGERLFRELMSG